MEYPKPRPPIRPLSVEPPVVVAPLGSPLQLPEIRVVLDKPVEKKPFELRPHLTNKPFRNPELVELRKSLKK